jgi:hypothetical protein
MDIQRVTLSDIVDFRPHELPDEELSRLESGKGVTELRRPLEEARLPGGWVGLRDKILAEAGGLLDIRLLDVMKLGMEERSRTGSLSGYGKIPAGQDL